MYIMEFRFRRKRTDEPTPPEGSLEAEWDDDRNDEFARRLARYGSRGMVKVGSSEGASVSPESVKHLTPAGSDHVVTDSDKQ
jgi:hypothetical protein